MTTPAFPELTPTPMPGDAALVSIANAERVARKGRREALAQPEMASIFTKVVEELAGFAVDMRAEFAAEIPAPFMKHKLTPEQIRRRVQQMSAAERQVLARKYGVRRFAEWAQRYNGKKG